MQIQCAFDPTRGLWELKDLFDLLHRYYDIIPDDPNKFKNMTYGNASDKDRQIADKERIIKKHEEQNAKNVKEIESLQQKVESLEKDLADAKNDAQELVRMSSDESARNKEQIDKLTKEKDEIADRLHKEHKQELDDVKNEKEKQISSLNKQVAELLKRISVYEPSLGYESEDKMYLNVFKTNLEETNSDDAPFVGKVNSNGDAIFQFNVEKGPHKDFTLNPDKYSAFCDIIDKVDGANHVAIDEWGTAFYNRGILVIKQRAKIKLTRE